MWSLTASPGQRISVSWRLPSAGSGDGQTRLRRPVGPCPATIVFVDGDDAAAAGDQGHLEGHLQGHVEGHLPEADGDGRPAFHGGSAATASLHATTCSVGSRSEPRLIYTSKTNQLYVRPTEVILARLLPSTHTDWKPYLIEYRSMSDASVYVYTYNELCYRCRFRTFWYYL